jgi:hypothetical protein
MIPNPVDRLDQALAALLRPVGERAPADELRVWADLCGGALALDWAAAPAAAEQFQQRVSAALARRAAEPGGLDDWSRAVGLTTALTVLHGARLGCTRLAPWMGGAGDLYEALAAALNRLYDGEARRAPAGPVAYAWVARAALLFAAGLGPHLGAAPAHYFDLLRQALAGPLPPAPAGDDRVAAYLRARAAPPSPEPPALPPRGDGTFGDRVRALFNGDPRRWTRRGALLAAGTALTAAALLAGAVLCGAARRAGSDFAARCNTPYFDAFRGPLKNH